MLGNLLEPRLVRFSVEQPLSLARFIAIVERVVAATQPVVRPSIQLRL